MHSSQKFIAPTKITVFIDAEYSADSPVIGMSDSNYKSRVKTAKKNFGASREQVERENVPTAGFKLITFTQGSRYSYTSTCTLEDPRGWRFTCPANLFFDLIKEGVIVEHGVIMSKLLYAHHTGAPSELGLVSALSENVGMARDSSIPLSSVMPGTLVQLQNSSFEQVYLGSFSLTIETSSFSSKKTAETFSIKRHVFKHVDSDCLEYYATPPKIHDIILENKIDLSDNNAAVDYVKSLLQNSMNGGLHKFANRGYARIVSVAQ
jgi:hypothetical protein